MAGFLIARAGRLLNQGDTVEYGGAKFIVERVSSRCITRVKMEHLREASPIDGDASANLRGSIFALSGGAPPQTLLPAAQRRPLLTSPFQDVAFHLDLLEPLQQFLNFEFGV